VRLAVDVHLPKGLGEGERTATILHMSRYYRSVDVRTLWRPFFGRLYPLTERDIRELCVKAGYSWVDVDVRGSGASFGHSDYPLSAADVRDGADVMDWIVDQPWSAGVIGVTGSSYDGVLARLLIGTGHPALKAVAPRFSGWDVYEDIFLPGGLLARSLLHDWSRLVSALDRGRLTDVFGWSAGMLTGGVRAVDRSALATAIADHDRNVDIERTLERIVYRDDIDPRSGAVTADGFPPKVPGGAASAVPTYEYAGWFDGALPRGQIRAYLANRRAGSRLRIGPWFHAGEFNASPDARGRDTRFDHAAEVIRFFDYHLRGVDNGFDRDAPVHYYTMGEERWKSAETWPPPGIVSTPLFLAPDGRLTPEAPPPSSGGDRYVVDESVKSGPGSRWGLIVGTGVDRGYDDRRHRDRQLLTYATAPLETDVEVTGHPVVHLFLSANAPDGGLFAYLEDVRPDGRVNYMTEGQLRLMHRKVAMPLPFAGPLHSYRRADALPVVPGEVTEAVFDLLPTSILFRAGHAIRLAIAGADAGTFDVPMPVRPVVYDVRRERAHPSRIELPIMTGQD
jgi:putative CocE/NonD family hydrolase